MSTTIEDTTTAPPAAEPGAHILDQIRHLEETCRRFAEDRDAAVARAELAETYGVALTNAIKTRDTEIGDLRVRLAEAREALRAATRPAQPPAASPAESEPAPPSPRAYDAPRRPVRRRSWRRPPRRH